MGFMELYNQWLNFDEATKEELLSIKDDQKEIEERFYKDLEFGTGGLRGIIGAGTNRMNDYTVAKASQGFANYLLKQKEQGNIQGELTVCIAYDSRRKSPEFAEKAALTMNANGIKTYLFDDLRPTPVLSFAIRHLGCSGGIVITASHNPPEYNGYKVYGDDGGQVPPPKDKEIIDEANSVTDYMAIMIMPKEEAVEKGLFNIIGKEVDDAYTEVVKALIIDPEVIEKVGEDLSIVFTPINGTGNIPVRRVLAEAGFKNVHVVKEQELPDSEFTTVGYPNPEDPKVFKLAVDLGDKVGADIIVGTDPDADRVGVVVKGPEGEHVYLTGNMIGAMLTEYILSRKKAKNQLPENAAVISTIVSTALSKAICDAYNVQYYKVLTGFKYIGEKIKKFEETGCNTFMLGFEESYGALPGTYARDKDAVSTTLLICEMAAYYKSRGMTMYDGLEEIYQKYGYFIEKIESLTLKGKEGQENIKSIMENCRKNTSDTFGGFKVAEYIDYKIPVEYPSSDVLYYRLAEGGWFCVRPSGTEPKIKVYFGVESADKKEAYDKLDNIMENVMKEIRK